MASPLSRLLWISAARPGRTSEFDACRHDKLTRKLREAGLGAIADLGFVGLDDGRPDADPAVITGYEAARNQPLTRDARSETVQHGTGGRPGIRRAGFAHLKNWRVLGKVRTAPTWATALVRAWFVVVQPVRGPFTARPTGPDGPAHRPSWSAWRRSQQARSRVVGHYRRPV
ncbi:hypothetical protein OG889_01725 [Streptomyces sp. NBC_00481]|uniref:hypothetical protein n=1 Tax=Streptomyces sp. NBC_00481 TaxID=2975755 RepID=UPI002DD8A92D|nr:hypothetical protein [Streptomyces sp. NBC_00481]WRY93545.1 hypothetical protein OG889_01725 [Streptomyces sp. NBC_00481]